MSSKHLSALLQEKGGPLNNVQRETPEPGPNEYLIEVKAVAMNPIDYYQRDLGIPPISQYPTVIGFDAAGVIAKLGSGITGGLSVGDHVTAFATNFFHDNNPDYGAFQQYVLVPSERVAALPKSISFEDGAVIPAGAFAAMTAYTTIGISLDTKYAAGDKEAILIWGASSSVGTFAVQSAKSLGFVIYATASQHNHEYIKKLGAHKVFDYKDVNVVSDIVASVKTDGNKLRTAHSVVTGALQPSLDVLKETKGDAEAKVVHSPVLPDDHPTLDNTTILFNYPSTDKTVRDEHFRKVFHGWITPGLQSGSIVPSPPSQIQGKGLEQVNIAIDTLKAGVSCKKIVVSL